MDHVLFISVIVLILVFLMIWMVTAREGRAVMSYWQLIFLQGKVNDGQSDGDGLPHQYWKWPRGTWFQERLRYVRGTQQRISQRIKPKNLEAALVGL